jgi:hypothetical protein
VADFRSLTPAPPPFSAQIEVDEREVPGQSAKLPAILAIPGV